MTNRALLMMGALALGAPAWAAPPGQGALPYPVSAYTDLRLATTQSQVADFNAPLQGSLSNRFGSLSARTDYWLRARVRLFPDGEPRQRDAAA